MNPANNNQPGRYLVRDCETGTTLEMCDDYDSARAQIKEFEHYDLEDGTYLPDSYEIYDSVTEEVIY